MRSEAALKTSEKKTKKIRPIASKGESVDFVLLVVTLVLVALGLTAVFSASYYSSISKGQTPYYYLIRDGIWVALGLALMAFGMMVDYRKYCNGKVVVLATGVCYLLLIVVLTPIGSTYNNASRWIEFGPISIMPGELIKVGMILFIAWFFGTKKNRIHDNLRGVLPVVILMFIAAALIMKQPNLSTAITLCGIVIAMLIVAGADKKWTIGLMLAGFIGVMGIILFVPGHWSQRFTSFLDPFQDAAGESYQVVQSLLALGSGGLTGVGLGKSVQKSLYLPEPQNDFILAIIGEETGFIGILVLMMIYCIFLWRCARAALKCSDQFGMLLASGVTLMVAIQVVLNIAVVTSSMPATGINLPFISYGGNALMIFMFLAGVVLNISKGEGRVIPAGEENESNNDRRRHRRTHISRNSNSRRDKEKVPGVGDTVRRRGKRSGKSSGTTERVRH
ncbi:MAG: putative lipid II flippase FtsW [Firmicutes bacterium]|nr:putative lipid II flippase FtsW [Bacillota bacterium]